MPFLKPFFRWSARLVGLRLILRTVTSRKQFKLLSESNFRPGAAGDKGTGKGVPFSMLLIGPLANYGNSAQQRYHLIKLLLCD